MNLSLKGEFKKLSDLYYDISNPLSFGNLTQTYQLSKDNKLTLTKQQLKQWHMQQVGNQVFKQTKQKSRYNKITCKKNDFCLQIDILDLQRFKTKNKKFAYMLNCIDVYSRYVWSFKLKTKSDKEVAPHITKLINYLKKRDPNRITVVVDAGTEFSSLTKWLEKNNITIYIANDKDQTKFRNSLIERWHRTFWETLKKVLLHNNTLKWIDYHDDIVNKYNNTVHSFTRMKPSDIFEKNEWANNKPYFIEKGRDKFNIGDSVRLLRNKKGFEKKSFTPNYTFDVFTNRREKGK